MGEKFVGAATTRVDHGQRGNRFTRKQSSRDFRNQRREDFSGKNPLKSVNARDSSRNARVMISKEEPRPTRKFKFHWAPKTKTLRITKRDGLPQATEWVGLDETKPTSRPTSPAESPKPIDLSPPEASGEHSKPGEDPSCHASTSTQVLFLATIDETPSEDMSKEDLAEAETTLGFEVVESEFPAQEVPAPLELVLHSSVLSNQENPAPLEMVLHSQCSTTAVNVEALPIVTSCLDASVEPSSPISCEPLLMVGLSEFCSPTTRVVEGVDALAQPSKWVSKHMNLFRQEIGVSIKGHESECLALLMRLDKDGKPKLASSCGKKSGKKGVRELKNLVSSVNYGAKELRRL